MNYQDPNHDWNATYTFFLRGDPINTINNEIRLRVENNNWNDQGFTINTGVPKCGFHDGVDNRALVLVCSRRRRGHGDVMPPLVLVALTDQEKLQINTTVALLYGF
jgi:hypothetical protein